MVQRIERFPAKLEVNTLMNLEVPEDAEVKPVEARPIDRPALFVADLNCRRRWRNKGRTIELQI